MKKVKLLPILSGSFRELLNSLEENDIVKKILEADKQVETLNIVIDCLEDSVYNITVERIKSLITDEVRMLTFRPGDLEVSFLPKDKEPEYTEDGKWARKNRQTGKPARIFQKLLKTEFKQKDWEIFSNLIKSEICDCNSFEIVSGEDIRNWYCEANYYQIKGTLGNSCMRYSDAQSYFDIYVDHAKMLITTKNGGLTGRALLWEIGDITLMDRVYTVEDYMIECFYDYAKEHKYWIRKNNSLLNTGNSQWWYTPDDNYQTINDREFSIKLKKDYEYFPYLDSFRYLKDGTLYTHWKDSCCELDSTDGSYTESDCTWECENCGRVYHSYSEDECPDEMRYSSYYDGYLCEYCSWYCEYIDDYVPNNVSTITLTDRNDNEFEVPSDAIDIICDVDGTEHKGEIVEVKDENNRILYYEIGNPNIEFNLDKGEYVLLSDAN